MVLGADFSDVIASRNSRLPRSDSRLLESVAAQRDELTPATLSPTHPLGDAQTRYFFLRRSSSMDAKPTPNTVIDAGSGTVQGTPGKQLPAKAGTDSIVSKKTEHVKRMDFS